jgi:hypothetical protein
MLPNVELCADFLSAPDRAEINVQVFEQILHDDKWHGGGSVFPDREFDFTAKYAEIAAFGSEAQARREKKPRF